MSTRKKIIIWLIPVVGLAFIALLGWIASSGSVAVLDARGSIASQQKSLLYFTLFLSAFVVVPVFVLTFFIAWKYREDNHKARYIPEWKSSKKLEALWWGIPIAIITVLAGVTWVTSHSLDPFKPIQSSTKPLEVQVVALQWKWLFIYPEQKVASVNLLHIPEKTPINFTITSDAPMNSLWIPNLGSQIYAMKGMSTKLHLIADQPGTYKGYSANISGEGFADMEFDVISQSRDDFAAWVDDTKRNGSDLDQVSYSRLAQPGVEDEPLLFALKDVSLYDTIVMKYMAPTKTGHEHDKVEGY